MAFRNKVLHQSPKDDSLKTVYAVTKTVGDRRVDLSVEELTLSVKNLVRHALTVPLDNHDDGPVLVGRDIEMNFDTDKGSDWFNGHVISKVNIDHRHHRSSLSSSLTGFYRIENKAVEHLSHLHFHNILCQHVFFICWCTQNTL